MAIAHGRLVGGFLAAIVFGLLWATPNRWEQLWTGDLPISLALAMTVLAFTAIYLLLRPRVSK